MRAEGSLTASMPRSAGRLSIASIILTGMAGATPIMVMPGLLANLSIPIALKTSQIALVSASEMVGIALTTAAISAGLDRLDRRRAAFAALALLIPANVLSFLTEDWTVLVAARFLAGLAAGALQGIVSASIATTSTPDRIFATYSTSNLIASTMLLGLLGQFSAARHPQGLFILLIIITILAMILVRWLPAGPAAKARQRASQGRKTHGAAALAATFALLVGIGLTWPLVGMIGLARHMSGEAVANTLSIATMAGILSGIAIFAIGNRIGRNIPIFIGTTGVIVADMLFIFGESKAAFVASCVIHMFSRVMIFPYYSGIVATLDPSGRLSALWMTMQFAGLAAGSFLAAGPTLSSDRLPYVIALPCFALAMAMMIYAERGTRCSAGISSGGLPK